MQIVQVVTLLAVVITAGWFSAFITQAIKREKWRSSVKLVLSIVVAALVGLATAWLSGDVTRFVTLWKSGGVTADQFLVLASLIYASASVWYRKYFTPSEWSQKLGVWPEKPAA